MTRYALSGLFLVAIAAIVYVLMSAAGGKGDQPSLAAYARGALEDLDFSNAGQPIPEGNFTDTDGTARSLAMFEGRTILVNYWATWCPPCEQEMPSLAALQAARGGETFEIVALSVDAPEDAEFARRRLEQLGASNIAFRHAPMDDGEIIYGAGVRGFPTTILYGPDGLEIARLAGEADWAGSDAVQFIDAALSQADANR